VIRASSLLVVNVMLTITKVIPVQKFKVVVHNKEDEKGGIAPLSYNGKLRQLEREVV
jgi:hypothetical protein